MKYRILLLITLVTLIFCGNSTVNAANGEAATHAELIKEQIKALKENTVAVNKLTETLKHIKFSGSPVNSSDGISGKVNGEYKTEFTEKEVEELVASLNWESNNNYKGFGDPRAVKGGTLVCVESSFPPTLRTVGKNANTKFNSTLSSFCYEALLDLDPITYEYAPNLAKRWAIADDKVTFFFELDERAKWSDGKPVVANDFVASWKLYTDPEIEDPFSVDFYSKFECPVAVTDKIIMVRSKQLNWRAFMSMGFMTILPAHYIENLSGAQYLEKYQFALMPGSGPYRYESSKVNENVILVRRSDWWQADLERTKGYYNFDKLDFEIVQDENLVKEKFKKGEIDWMRVNVAREWHQEFTAAKMQAISNGWIQRRKVYTHIPIGTSGIAFNIRKPPFDDIRVRLAFAHLYNREKMMDKLFFNEYGFLDSFYQNSLYENPTNPKVRYDPDKAVELLEEAGWKQENRNKDGWLVKDGKIFELNLNLTDKGSERIYTILQEDLKDVGIKLNLKLVTWATDIKEVGERNFTISSRAYTGLMFPNPESSMHSKYADLPNNNNIWGFKNKRVDEICEQYPLMFNVKDRIAAVREIDKIATEQHLYALGWFAAHTRLLYWNKFGMPDFVLSKTGDEDSLLSLWWFDKDKAQALKEAKENGTKLPVGEEIVKWWDKNYPPNGETK